MGVASSQILPPFDFPRKAEPVLNIRDGDIGWRAHWADGRFSAHFTAHDRRQRRAHAADDGSDDELKRSPVCRTWLAHLPLVVWREGVRRQSVWDSLRLKIGQSLTRLVGDVMRLQQAVDRSANAGTKPASAAE